jgi:hypothetical protein
MLSIYVLLSKSLMLTRARKSRIAQAVCACLFSSHFSSSGLRKFDSRMIGREAGHSIGFGTYPCELLSCCRRVKVSVADHDAVPVVEHAEEGLACADSRESVQDYVTAYLYCL